MFDTQSELRAVWAILVLFGIWLLLSIPAYAALSVWMQLREALTQVINRLWDTVSKLSERMAANGARIRLELLQRLRWFEVDASAKTAWAESVEAVWRTADANKAELASARSTALEALKIFQPLLVRVTQLKLAADIVPTVPTLQQALRSTERSRVALTNVLIASVLLVPIVLANAQMTGLVLSEVIPPVQPLLGIPIPLLVAAVLVLAEAGIGVLHSSEAESRAGTERSFTVMTAVWTFAAIGVIGIETLLYGFVQPQNVTRIPVAGSVFGLVGAVLGLAVFGLGRLWHHSLMTVRKERTPKVTSKHLKELQHAAQEWNSIAERLEPQQAQAVAQFERLTVVSGEAAGLQLTALTKAHAEFERHRVALPAWATTVDRPLTEAEFQHRESRTYLWLFITALATLSATVIAATIVRRLAPSTGAVLGFAATITAFAVGAFSQVAPRRRFYTAIATAASGILVVFVAALAGRFLRGEVSAHALVIAVPNVAAFFAGVRIGPDAALLRLPIWLALRALAVAPLFMWALVLWLIDFVAAIVEYGLRIIAWPLSTVLSIRKQTAATEHASV